MRLAHVGTFDVRNVGDLLFVDIFERQIQSRLPGSEIVLFSPTATMLPNTNKVIHPIEDLELLQEGAPFDGIVVGGGDLVHVQQLNILLSDDATEPSKYDAAESWITPSLVAWKHRIPLIWNCLGVPAPFLASQSVLLRTLASCVDYLSVRDESSKIALEEAGVPSERINIVPDTVLSISTLFSKEEVENWFATNELDEDGYIVFQCNTTFSDDELIDYGVILEHLKSKTGLRILLQDIGTGLDDREGLCRLNALFPDSFILASDRFDQYQVVSVLKNAKLYIGSSMHGFIISQSFGTPSLMIDKNGLTKIKGVASLLDQEACVLSGPIDLYETACAILDSSVSLPQEVLEKIDAHFDAVAKTLENGAQRQDDPGFIWGLTKALTGLCRAETAQRQMTEECSVMRQQRDRFRDELEKVYQSQSWKITEPLRSLRALTSRQSHKES